jgi:hypothetical protein
MRYFFCFYIVCLMRLINIFVTLESLAREVSYAREQIKTQVSKVFYFNS